MPSVDDVLAELAAVPPTDFARERRALVARLTKSGQAEAAARLKAMPRPTTAVWAVNRVARDERETIDRFIAASQRMRAAQLGRAGTRDLATVSADHRAALARLSERAAAILRRASLGASHQILLRIQTTLTAAAADPALRSALRHGRLEREVAARGFDVFAGEVPHPPRRSDATSAVTTRAPDEASTRAEELIASARQALSRQETEATDRRKELTVTQDRITELTKLLKDARRAESAASREARRAATSVRAAWTALRAAEKRGGSGRRRPKA